MVGGKTAGKGEAMIYKGYSIEFNIYGQNEYTVEFEGDDVWFTSLSEAKQFIDSITE